MNFKELLRTTEKDEDGSCFINPYSYEEVACFNNHPTHSYEWTPDTPGTYTISVTNKSEKDNNVINTLEFYRDGNLEVEHPDCFPPIQVEECIGTVFEVQKDLKPIKIVVKADKQTVYEITVAMKRKASFLEYVSLFPGQEKILCHECKERGIYKVKITELVPPQQVFTNSCKAVVMIDNYFFYSTDQYWNGTTWKSPEFLFSPNQKISVTLFTPLGYVGNDTAHLYKVAIHMERPYEEAKQDVSELSEHLKTLLIRAVNERNVNKFEIIEKAIAEIDDPINITNPTPLELKKSLDAYMVFKKQINSALLRRDITAITNVIDTLKKKNYQDLIERANNALHRLNERVRLNLEARALVETQLLEFESLEKEMRRVTTKFLQTTRKQEKLIEEGASQNEIEYISNTKEQERNDLEKAKKQKFASFCDQEKKRRELLKRIRQMEEELTYNIESNTSGEQSPMTSKTCVPSNYVSLLELWNQTHNELFCKESSDLEELRPVADVIVRKWNHIIKPKKELVEKMDNNEMQQDEIEAFLKYVVNNEQTSDDMKLGDVLTRLFEQVVSNINTLLNDIQNTTKVKNEIFETLTKKDMLSLSRIIKENEININPKEYDRLAEIIKRFNNVNLTFEDLLKPEEKAVMLSVTQKEVKKPEFYFCPNVPGNLKIFYEEDLKGEIILQRITDSVSNIVSYMKQCKTAKISLSTAGKEKEEKMQIGHYIRKQLLPALVALFENGIEDKGSLWKFVEVCAGDNTALQNLIFEIDEYDVSDLIGIDQSKENLSRVKLKIFLCHLLNKAQGSLGNFVLSVWSMKNTTSIYYNESECLFLSDLSSYSRFSKALQSISKLSFELITDFEQNCYHPSTDE